MKRFRTFSEILYFPNILLMQCDLLQGAQDALLQHQARGEGHRADADGCAVLGEGVTADQFEPR